ncbi:hypothetical protein FALBO_16155, partial [Fusarium albosuccineum]
STGCTLVELFTGDVLFDIFELPEYLAMIEAVSGLQIEKEIPWVINGIFETTLTNVNFFALREAREKVNKMGMYHLDQIIAGDNPFLESFADLLKRIFVFDPDQRITAKDALQHPCLKETTQPDEALKFKVKPHTSSRVFVFCRNTGSLYPLLRPEVETLGIIKILMRLVEASDARHYGQELTIIPNQTALLLTVTDRHSATKSTALSIGGVAVLGMGGRDAVVSKGFPISVPVGGVVGVIAVVVAVNTSLNYKNYRDRVRQNRNVVKPDFDTFRLVCKTVMRAIALQFTASAGINPTIKDERF